MPLRFTVALALLLTWGCDEAGEPVPPVGESVREMSTPLHAKPGGEPAVPEGISEISMEVGEGEEATTMRVWLAPPGDGVCTQAYNTSVAWVQGMQRLWGGVESYPDRDEFLEVCAELPEQVKRCMLLDYAFENRRQCEEARDALDPALAARLRAVSPVAEE